MTNTIDQDRKEFEAWIKKYNQETQMTIREDGEYLLPEYQRYWEGWCSARAQLQQERQASEQSMPSQSVVDENAACNEDLPIREQYSNWYETCTNEDIFNLWQSRAKLVEQPTSQDKADAVRYRWLRHGDNDELVIQHGPVVPDYHWLPRNERLDAMIDAAMKESK